MPQTPEQRLGSIVSKALGFEIEDARSACAIAYSARVLAQVTLPHSAPADNQFSRRNGDLTLSMWAPAEIGLPYGSIPRLLLGWVTTEAVRTKQRELLLGDTLSAFMRQLGLVPTGGRWGTIPRLRSQMARLFSTAIRATAGRAHEMAGVGWMVADRYHLWWDPKAPDDPVLWQSTVTLGQQFFDAIVDRPVPIDTRALAALPRSPLATDLYTWLTYRMSYLTHPSDDRSLGGTGSPVRRGLR